MLRRIASGCAVAFAALLLPCGPAAADTKLITTPPEQYAMAPGGVDMRTGHYVTRQTDLSIGPASGGLSLVRLEATGLHEDPFGNFSHNWDIMAVEMRVDLNNPTAYGQDYRMNIVFDGRSAVFDSYSYQTGYAAKADGPVTQLTYAGGDRASAAAVYTFTAADGTIAVFRPMGIAQHNDCSSLSRCAYVSKITQPDGTELNFSYAIVDDGRTRLQQVTSSRGYALLFEANGFFTTKACVLNLAVAPAPANGLCPSGAPAVSYGYVTFNGTSLANVTSPSGAVSDFTYADASSAQVHMTAMGFVKPGQTAPWLTNTFYVEGDEWGRSHEIVIRQAFADGQSYSYEYDRGPIPKDAPAPPLAGGRYTDARNHIVYVTYDWPQAPGGSTPGSACTHFPCSPPIPTIRPSSISRPRGR